MKNKTKSRLIIITVIITIVLIGGCSSGGGTTSPNKSTSPNNGEDVVPKGGRMLGVAITVAEDNDYDSAFNTAETAANLEIDSLAIAWDDVETSPTVYNPDPNFLAIANAFYPTKNIKVALEINPIDTSIKRVPSDLIGTAFNDPVMIQRFKDLIDYVFTQIPDLELVSLTIGNEIDVYLGTDSALWAEYQEFFNAIKAYVKTGHPALNVGVKGTFDGLTDTAKSYLETLNQNADVVMVTYYPLNNDFTVQDPDVVESDFQELLSIYSGKPIYFLEAGYPSSSLCNSSEEKQAEFIKEVFESWDNHSSEIPFIIFIWLTDISQTTLDYYESYYGVSDQKFLGFLGTLGLRTYAGSGTDKKAFTTLQTEAKARGW